MRTGFGDRNYTRSEHDRAFGIRSYAAAYAAARATRRREILADQLFDLMEKKEDATRATPALDQRIARATVAFANAGRRADDAERRVPTRGIRP